MKLRVGYEIAYDCAQSTPMMLMLNIHSSRLGDLLTPDVLRTNPFVPVAQYHDSFGNLCSRIIAPPGRIILFTEALLSVPGQHETMPFADWQHPVEELSSDVLVFLLGSRYCETDLLSDTAWEMFGQIQGGRAKVQAVCDFAHNHLQFDYAMARPTRTAWEAYRERSGVCRDFAHLAIALCRALNIPSRYCTGYISDVGLPPTNAPMDFCAWFEAYIGGSWQTFDPRNNAPRTGRVLMARGRDAADIAISNNFGPAILVNFRVICEPAEACEFDLAYSSSNGDCWQVVRHFPAGRMSVRHVPNPSSGGLIQDYDVNEFLRRNGPGPEYAAVRHLVGRGAPR